MVLCKTLNEHDTCLLLPHKALSLHAETLHGLIPFECLLRPLECGRHPLLESGRHLGLESFEKEERLVGRGAGLSEESAAERPLEGLRVEE